LEHSRHLKAPQLLRPPELPSQVLDQRRHLKNLDSLVYRSTLRPQLALRILQHHHSHEFHKPM
jgi:hypothetical protein